MALEELPGGRHEKQPCRRFRGECGALAGRGFFGRCCSRSEWTRLTAGRVTVGWLPVGHAAARRLFSSTARAGTWSPVALGGGVRGVPRATPLGRPPGARGICGAVPTPADAPRGPLAGGQG